VIFVKKYVSWLVLECTILGGVQKIQGNPYLKSKNNLMFLLVTLCGGVLASWMQCVLIYDNIEFNPYGTVDLHTIFI